MKNPNHIFKKMVRIGWTPVIVHEEDRWGVQLPTFMVANDTAGYVDKKFWEDLQEFEHHDIGAEVAQVAFESGLIIDGNLDSILNKLPITKRLLDRSKYQIWEFNALVGYEQDDSSTYVRMYAMLGQPALKRWTFIDDIRVAYLRWKCKRMNEKVNSQDN